MFSILLIQVNYLFTILLLKSISDFKISYFHATKCKILFILQIYKDAIQVNNNNK
jgi:hypothetical protein